MVEKRLVCKWFGFQMGNEIRTSLDFEWTERGWFANDLDFKCDLKLGRPTIRNLDKWSPVC